MVRIPRDSQENSLETLHTDYTGYTGLNFNTSDDYSMPINDQEEIDICCSRCPGSAKIVIDCRPQKI